MPKSLFLFAFAGALFFLQYLAGGMLYFLGAPLWSIALINLGFIGIFIETIFGLANKYWLVLPILWFGGYTGFAAWSHCQCSRAEQEISSRNVNASVHFSKASGSLVLTSHNLAFGELSKTARLLVKDYQAPVVFHDDAPQGRYLATRLATGEACDPSKFADSSVMEFVSDPVIGNRSSWKCWISIEELPRAPVISVNIEASEARQIGWEPVTTDTLSLTTADGASTEAFKGFATPLSWWPTPVLGFCYEGALGGGALVNCSGFMREGWLLLNPNDAKAYGLAATIASALGIGKRSP
jgi:hypothetical protein